MNYNKLYKLIEEKSFLGFSELLNVIKENVKDSNEIKKILGKFEINSEIETETEISKIHNILLASLTGIDVSKMKDERIINFFKCLFNDIMDIEGVNIGDIQFLGVGRTSVVYSVGGKVIKFSYGDEVKRDTPEIDIEHPRILKSLVRMPIEGLNDPNVTISFVEVQNKLKTRKFEEFEVRMVFEELMEAGWVWADPKGENMAEDENGNIFIIDVDSFYRRDKVIGENGELKKDKELPSYPWFIKMYNEYAGIEEVYQDPFGFGMF